MTDAFAKDLEFAGPVDDRLDPEDEAVFVIHLEGVACDLMANPQASVTLPQIGLRFALEGWMQLAPQGAYHGIAAEAEAGMVHQGRVQFRCFRHPLLLRSPLRQNPFYHGSAHSQPA